MNTTIKNIKRWAVDKGLHTADTKAQLSKLMEEAGELATAINKDRGVEDVLEALERKGDVQSYLMQSLKARIEEAKKQNNPMEVRK